MHTTRPKIQIKRSIVNRSPCIVGAPVELEYDPEEQVEQAEAPESHTPARLPSVERQACCVGDRSKMVKHKAWATTTVAPR